MAYVMWGIWAHRNKVVVEGQDPNPVAVKKQVIDQLQLVKQACLPKEEQRKSTRTVPSGTITISYWNGNNWKV